MRNMFLAVVFIASFKSIVAQSYKDMMLNNAINFYTVVDSAEAYFKTIDKTKKGSGYVPFMRWKYLNESKYAPSGDRQNIDPYLAAKSYLQILASQKKVRALNTAWREIGPVTIDSITGHYAVGLGRIEEVYVHKSDMNIIYAGTRSGGFWKSINGGSSWQGKMTDTLFATGVNAITASPTNADSILINVRNSNNGTSHGIYRSINGGATWQVSNFNPTTINAGGLGSSFQIYKIYYHPTISNLIFIGTNQGLYRSDDNLATWIRTYNTSQITQIDFHPTNENIMYMYDNASGGANENKILISYNSGVTFSPSNTIPGNNNSTIYISTTTAAPNNVYIGSNTGVWKSIDSGKNFILKQVPSLGIKGFAINTNDTTKMIYGYVDLLKSSDEGSTSTQCSWWGLFSAQHGGTNNSNAFANSKNYIHADVNILKCVNGIFFGGSDGYVFKSVDNGATFNRLGEGMGIREYYCVGTSQSNHYVSMLGSQDNGESIAKKDHWVEFYGADGMESLVHPLNDNWIIGSVQYGNRRRTKDGGLTQDNASPSVSDGDWVAPLLNDPVNQMHLYDFTDSVFKSEDFGSTWRYIGKPTFGGNITQAAIAYNNSKIMVASKSSAIQKSINGGLTWANTKNNLPTKTFADIAFSPINDSILAVTFDNHQADNQKIYITTNGGTTWKNITYNLGNMPLHTVLFDHTPEQNIYVGAEIGIYVKSITDTVWQLYKENLPNMTVTDLELCWGSNTIKAATWGRGLWENSLKGRANYPAIVYTNITDRPSDELPKVFTNQFVTSSIHYTNTLSKVYVMYGEDTIALTNKIDMAFVSDSTWKTISPLPNSKPNSKIYFQVVAVGSNQDTTTTFRFMYNVLPSEYCNANGFNDGGDLHITDVEIADVYNSTANDTYSYFNAPIIDLNKAAIYTITVKASTSWGENDFGAWIDFNGDRTFDTNSETILFKPNNGGQASATFSLPAYYNTVDTFRMRVRLSYWGGNPEPCGTVLGEVEDYAVKMNYPTGILTVLKNNMTVRPNPALDVITIKLPTPSANPIIISGLNGIIYKKVTNNNFDEISIDIKTLPVGTHLIKCGQYKSKFVKQ
jgi:hypothetical protein